jgi:hypothetical protein
MQSEILINLAKELQDERLHTSKAFLDLHKAIIKVLMKNTNSKKKTQNKK